MSASALLRAFETHLRTVLSDADGKYSRVMPDDRPPPGFGQRFYSVHPAGVRDRQEATTADQTDAEYAVSVTIAARIGVAPTDRQGAKITGSGDLIDLAEALAVPGVISGNYELMGAVNALIPGTAEHVAANGGDGEMTTNGFVEPLLFLGYSNPQERAANWCRSDPKAPTTDVWSITVRFGRARRIQVKGD